TSQSAMSLDSPPEDTSARVAAGPGSIPAKYIGRSHQGSTRPQPATGAGISTRTRAPAALDARAASSADWTATASSKSGSIRAAAVDGGPPGPRAPDRPVEPAPHARERGPQRRLAGARLQPVLGRDLEFLRLLSPDDAPQPVAGLVPAQRRFGAVDLEALPPV